MILCFLIINGKSIFRKQVTQITLIHSPNENQIDMNMNIGIRYNFLLFIIQMEILILELDDKILTKYNTYTEWV